MCAWPYVDTVGSPHSILVDLPYHAGKIHKIVGPDGAYNGLNGPNKDLWILSLCTAAVEEPPDASSTTQARCDFTVES